jgi:hypothetical protein
LVSGDGLGFASHQGGLRPHQAPFGRIRLGLRPAGVCPRRALKIGIANTKSRPIMALVPRFPRVPEGSLFLFGPRGTGKTTWLRKQLPDALFVNLLRPEVYRELAARPERLRELVRGDPGSRNVVVDDVQRVPELLHVVHDLLEEPSSLRFVLTGSSARKLRRGGVDAWRPGVRCGAKRCFGKHPRHEPGSARAPSDTVTDAALPYPSRVRPRRWACW